MGFVLSISKVVSIFVFGFWVLNIGSHAQRLVEEEVEVLKEIAKTIGKSNWNFNVDPCSGQGGWVTANGVKGFENNVSCDCSSDTICHVVSMLLAPEYVMRGYLTDKADVYSFGVVVLEIVSGKSNTNYRPKEGFVYLLDWAYVLQEQGNLLELVDPILGSNYSTEEAMRMLNLALLCTNPSPTLRPSMSSAVSMLQDKMPVQAPLIKRSGMNQDARFKAFEVLSQDSQTHVSTFSDDSQVRRSMFMDGPRLDSSVSLTSKDEILEYSS